MFDRYLSSETHTILILRAAYDWHVTYGHDAPRMGIVCTTIRPYCGGVGTRQTPCRTTRLPDAPFRMPSLEASIHSASRSFHIPLVLSYSTSGVSAGQSGRWWPSRPIGIDQPRRECKRLYRVIHGWELAWMKAEHVRLMTVMSHSGNEFHVYPLRGQTLLLLRIADLERQSPLRATRITERDEKREDPVSYELSSCWMNHIPFPTCHNIVTSDPF